MSNPGFVTVRNGKIVDPDGQPLLLRGMGLGNWLLAEGYMWKLSPGRESAREIEALVVELVGPERADEFWRRFRDNFINADDIDRIAAEGMDHVRLPINWRIVMADDGSIRPDGFDRIDALIGWCRSAGIRVLLDLHGAPGGQTGTNIDDSLGQPELFMDERYKDLTEKLWVAIASRYSDEPTVIGYDLLNEPIPNEWQHRYPDELVDLYKRLTAAIRTVDKHHLLMYEGSHWATNWSIFTEVWDENSVLQFHKYWSPADRPSIQQFLDVGQRLGLPIYMGEGGENNADWIATAFQMYEDLDIGWNFWPWKKIDTRTSPCSIVTPAGWEAIVRYANGTAEAPDPDEAWATLTALADAASIGNCDYHTDIVNATLRKAPLSLTATAFGFRGPGVSFSTDAGSSILPDFRSDDAVRIELGDNMELPAFDNTDGAPDIDLVVALDTGDWVSYSIALPGGPVTIVVTTSEEVDAPDLHIDGVALAAQGSYSGQTTYSSPYATPGRCDLRVSATADATKLRRIEVT
jgi:endoglucanase